jgi:putative ABC transport system permease protein
MHDLKFAFRQLLKNPGFTVVAVITLALGIGLNTAVFSIIKPMLLAPVRVEDPDRLVEVFHCPLDRLNVLNRFTFTGVASADFLDWQRQSQSLESMTAFFPAEAILRWEGDSERVKIARVSANLFPLLRIKPMLGRAFRPDDDNEGSEPVTILSHTFWQRRFGADPNIIGKTFDLQDGNRDGAHTIVGVMPPGPPLFNDRDLWKANPFGDLPRTGRGSGDPSSVMVLARLKPGISAEQAQAEMQTIETGIIQAYPDKARDAMGKWVARVRLVNSFMARRARPYLLILLAAVGFILLMVCANVANLVLARAAVREAEIAMRAALGASRWRLIRQLLVESVLLSVLGGAVGLFIAVWTSQFLAASAPSGYTIGTVFRPDVPLEAIGIDRGVLAFNLLLALLVGILFALAPALRTSKPDLNSALKEGGRMPAVSPGGQWLGKTLIVVQVASAMVLLIAAGLLIHTLSRLAHHDLGYNPNNLLVMRLNLSPEDKFRAEALSPTGLKFLKSLPQRETELSEMVQHLDAVPGVEGVGIKHAVRYQLPFHLETGSLPGSSGKGDPQEESVNLVVLTPECFKVMGIKLLRGRGFNRHDGRGAPEVRIVNQAFVARYFPNEDPIGKRIVDWSGKRCEIIGVVSDNEAGGSYAEIGQIREGQIEPEMYVSLGQEQAASLDLDIMIRISTGSEQSLASAVRKTVRDLDHDSPIISLQTMREVLSNQLNISQFFAVNMGILAALALVLSAIGIYGVIAYSVGRRTHEIGVRMAMGAEQIDVLALVVRQGMGLALAGIAIGLGCAVAVARLLSSLLYGIAPTDTVTFIGTALMLMAVALLACWLPARRAARLDPMEALRYE